MGILGELVLQAHRTRRGTKGSMAKLKQKPSGRLSQAGSSPPSGHKTVPIEDLPTVPSKRDFCAHIWQYLHYVEDEMCTKIYNKVHWRDSLLRKKGEQIKTMMRAMED